MRERIAYREKMAFNSIERKGSAGQELSILPFHDSRVIISNTGIQIHVPFYYFPFFRFCRFLLTHYFSLEFFISVILGRKTKRTKKS